MVNKEVWGKSTCMGLWDKVQTVGIFVSHVHVHQKGSSAEEVFNNLADKKSCLVPSARPCPQPSQRAHIRNKHGGGEETMPAHHSTAFLSPRLGCLLTLPNTYLISAHCTVVAIDLST